QGGRPLAYKDFLAGDILLMMYDGTQFQCLNPVDQLLIKTPITINIKADGSGDFPTLIEAMDWLTQRRISDTGSVTLAFHAGVHTYASQVITWRHPDGSRIIWNGAALTGGGFPTIGNFTCTGNSSGARASDTTANLAMLRARFTTEFKFTGAGSRFEVINPIGGINNMLFTSDRSSIGANAMFNIGPLGNVSFFACAVCVPGAADDTLGMCVQAFGGCNLNQFVAL